MVDELAVVEIEKIKADIINDMNKLESIKEEEETYCIIQYFYNFINYIKSVIYI